MSFFVHFSGVSIRTLIGAGILFWLFSGCTTSEDRALSQEEYIQAVSDFHVSLAASQTDEARFAFNKMNEVAVAYPKEAAAWANLGVYAMRQDRKSTRLNSSHVASSYAVFCLKKKKHK